MNNKILIIAEAGVNHNGNFEVAKQMVKVAKKAGADIVKFQTAVPELVMVETAPKAKYQNSSTDASESQIEMARSIHLPLSDYKKLKEYCNNQGIEFLSTPFDSKSIDTLSDIEVETFKIPSGEITNYPYLRKIGQLNKQIILSTGMSVENEIAAAIDLLVKSGTKRSNISLLHCTTEYPAPFADVNLLAMKTMTEKFHLPVGYSDHTVGIEVSIAAAALGAVIIEKHFTLDKNMKGPDHKASLEPDELEAMVKAIRNIELSLGDGKKKVSVSEKKNIPIARKSIVAFSNIKKGEPFTESNLTTKRPGTGLNPMEWPNVIGRLAKRDFKYDDLITL